MGRRIDEDEIILHDTEGGKTDKCKRFSVTYIVAVSLFSIVMGILTITFGYRQMLGKYQDKDSRKVEDDGAESEYETRYGNPLIYGKVYSFLPEFEDFTFERNVFAELSLFGGIFAIVTGFLGFATVLY